MCLRLEQGPVLGQFLLVPASFHGRTASGAWKADILTSHRQAARILAFPHGVYPILHWFGPRFEPQFTDLKKQLKALYCADDPSR
jgi:hypothetical protein